MKTNLFASRSPSIMDAQKRLSNPNVYGTRQGQLGSLAKTKDKYAVNNAKGDTSQNAALMQQARQQAINESGGAMQAEANMEAMADKARADAQAAINPPQPMADPQNGQFYQSRKKKR